MNSFKSNWFVYLLFTFIFLFAAYQYFTRTNIDNNTSIAATDSTWSAPSLYFDEVTKGKERQMIMYGEQLIANTSQYLGPNGTVAHITNGMNCQNCHLAAGTLAWGNNYGAVYSTYPKYRGRSNKIDGIYDRINDCLERSLNGSPLDSSTYEMQCIYTYIKWLGKNVERGKKPYGSGLPILPFMNRAANIDKGELVYINTCQRCHGENGAGIKYIDRTGYQYPPLWGNDSYNDGAGLYRITRFASFIKSNMPFDQATHNNPALSNEDAWDVAAFVNAQPRPHKDQSGDWGNISKKAIDEPFGPYVDSFSELQHKYGPYKSLDAYYKNLTAAAIKKQ